MVPISSIRSFLAAVPSRSTRKSLDLKASLSKFISYCLNSERPMLITTDKHIVRIWDPETGDGMTSIEPTAGAINDMCVFGESGLMLLALATIKFLLISYRPWDLLLSGVHTWKT